MFESCKVPGCRAVRKDDRGYCEGHIWILPLRERTPSEILERLQEKLRGGWSGAIMFLADTPGGDLPLPDEWVEGPTEDLDHAEKILQGLLEAAGYSELRGLPVSLQAVLEDDFRKATSMELEELLAVLRNGGELRKFRSPPESWKNLCGRAGYAIVKDGNVLWSWVTMMN